MLGALRNKWCGMCPAVCALQLHLTCSTETLRQKRANQWQILESAAAVKLGAYASMSLPMLLLLTNDT